MGAWASDVESDPSEPNEPMMAIDAAVFDPEGRDRVAVSLRGPRNDPDHLGKAAAQALRERGAEPLLKRLS